MIDFTYSHLLFGMSLLGIILIILRRRKRSFWYLLFFSIFWCYLLFVVSVIVFPIIPFPGDYPGTFKPNINLVPFYFGTCYMPATCIRNIAGNILLTIPFGFGISFFVRLKSKDFIWLAILVGFIFEITQLILSVVFQSSFRAIDINDVILNAIGVWLGYGLFRIFGYIYLHVTQRFEITNKYLFAYIYDVFCQSQ